MTTTKTSKIDSLKAALEVAKKNLADATARLQPQITAEQARVDDLRAAMDKAQKASSKAYAEYQAAQRDAQARLFPVETQKRLRAAIKTYVTEKGFPMASVEGLALRYEDAQVLADAEYSAARARFAVASDHKDTAYRLWNIANSLGGKLYQLQRELDGFKNVVEALDKEIERLPRYRQTQKDRREQERQENIVSEQTAAAQALMADFRFDK